MSGARAVVVTGMSGVSPLGADWPSVRAALLAGESGVVHWDALDAFDGMRTRLAAPAVPAAPRTLFPRKKSRTMGRASVLAAVATEAALAQAGLEGQDLLSDGSTGLCYGTSLGSLEDLEAYGLAIHRKTTKGILPYVGPKMMSHTVASNLASLYAIRGSVFATCSACTSGSQAIGAAFDQIRFGRQDRMICGGAEELHPALIGIFDIMFATSVRNDAPAENPRPFDADRDGLVVGEGAGTFILEARDVAEARGAPILAELVGYGTNCDGKHITAPDTDGMEGALRRALADAQLEGDAIDYVNAHATATDVGDVAESLATHRAVGEGVPVSSLKGVLGHTLGACGPLEAWMTLGMAAEGWVAPTAHLETPDPACAPLDYVQSGVREGAFRTVMANNFAFGGINTSLIFRLP